MLNSEEYSVAGQCIILSQTFYTEKLSQKTYLQSEVVDHTFFKQENLWEIMINEAIENEIKKYSEYCKDFTENPEDTYQRISEVVVSQLSSYAHIMESFQMKDSIVQDILGKLVKKYNLQDDVLTMFMA